MVNSSVAESLFSWRQAHVWWLPHLVRSPSSLDVYDLEFSTLDRHSHCKYLHKCKQQPRENQSGDANDESFSFFSEEKDCWRVHFLLCIIEFSAPEELEVHFFGSWGGGGTRKDVCRFFSALVSSSWIQLLCVPAGLNHSSTYSIPVLCVWILISHDLSVYFSSCAVRRLRFTEAWKKK